MIDWFLSLVGKNKKLRKSYYEKPCLVCGSTPSDPAHLISYAVCLEDREENIIPLCRLHHTEQHTIGLRSFVEKYNLPIEWETTGKPTKKENFLELLELTRPVNSRIESLRIDPLS